METKAQFKQICKERGLTAVDAARQLCYSPEHVHRVLSGATPATARFCLAIRSWSGGRIDLQRQDKAA